MKYAKYKSGCEDCEFLELRECVMDDTGYNYLCKLRIDAFWCYPQCIVEYGERLNKLTHIPIPDWCPKEKHSGDRELSMGVAQTVQK